MQFKETQAIYLQIAEIIEDGIVRKEWGPGERIPSVRDLAVEMGVNPNTVVKSFELLQQKGAIYNKRGIGYFVSEDAGKLILQEIKNRFVIEDLPAFFNKISLLGYSPEEISDLYYKYLQKRRSDETDN